MHHRFLINNNNPEENDTNKIFELSRVKNSDKVPAIKYLGVYFDENVSFKHHTTICLTSCIMISIHIVWLNKHSTSNLIEKPIHYSLFHCHIIYTTGLWSTASPSVLQPPIIKQKATKRIVANKYITIILNCFRRTFYFSSS